MRFGLLGPVEVTTADGHPVSVGGRQARSLLARLLRQPDRSVTAAELIAALYDERAPSDPGHALQAQVSRLRGRLRTVGGDGLLEFGPAGYRLRIDPDQVDAVRFERLAAAGRVALDAGSVREAAGRLDEALALWRGAPLSDVIPAAAARSHAGQLEESRIAAIEDRSAASLLLGDYRTVAAQLPAWVAQYPLRERLRGLLMRGLYGCDRQAEALQTFEQLRHLLAEELGVDPSPELRDLHLALLRSVPPHAGREPVAGEASVGPGGLIGHPAPNGLPAAASAFHGRDDDLRRIAKLLREKRLLTVTGPGGVGKTRLAIRAAAQDSTNGEVCFVDLVGSEGVSGAETALLRALGLRESGVFPTYRRRPESVARAISALAGRSMLLVLDNCEHLIDPVAELAGRLLASCPGLRILATSREPLGIAGEALHLTDPMAVPSAGSDLADAFLSPAVRLFADRAVDVDPDFDINDDNLDDVLRICRELDGLPLAIELAAARLRSMSVADIASRLDDRFRLLSRGDRGLPPGRRTLHAVISWSWDLLSSPERLLARRFAVFVGGASAGSVAAVCDIEPAEADELLGALVDKSLLTVMPGRFRMLETVRMFCAERLTEATETDRLQRAHAEHFVALADDVEPRLRGSTQLAALVELDTDIGNLDAAMHRSVESNPVRALGLLASLSWYGYLRGRTGEWTSLSARLVTTLGAEPPVGLAEEYTLCLAHAVAGGSDGELFSTLLERIRADSMRRVFRYPLSPLLHFMTVGPGNIEQPQGGGKDTDPESDHDTNVAWFQAVSAMMEGVRRVFDDDSSGGDLALDQALLSFRKIGDRWGIANTLDQRATIAVANGDPIASLEMLDEAIDLVGELGADDDLARLSIGRADALTAAGELDAADRCYRQALEITRRSGMPETNADVHRGLGELALARGELAGARDLFGIGMRDCEGESMTTQWIRSRLHSGLGRLALAEGDAEKAGDHFRSALALVRDHHNRPAMAAAGAALDKIAGRGSAAVSAG